MIKKITLCALLLCAFSSIFATDYYVNANDGNDNNSGTSVSNAFRSLRKISQTTLQAGDNVYVMNGTYNSNGGNLLVIDESGTADNWITIQNYQDHKPLLQFSGWTGIDIINGASYIKIKGLRIQGARSKVTLEDALAQPGSCQNNQEGGANGLYNGTGILVVGPNLKWSNPATTGDEIPHHITIEDCEVFDCTSSGMAFQQADYITVRNNKIYDNCWYTLYGTSGVNLYQFINTDGTTGTHNIITNNLMYGNQLLVPQVPYCLFLDGNAFIVDDFRHIQIGNYKNPEITFPKYNARTLITNNIAVNNGGSGLHFFLSTNCDIYNNTVVNNAFQNGGINNNSELRIGGCEDFKIKNNIITGEFKIHNNSENSDIDYTHNYQSGIGIDASLADCENCLDGELVFENEDVNDPRPYITSIDGLLKDVGTTISEVSSDYLGNLRSDTDGSFDIGAYELQSCYLATWYADVDGDGAGDIATAIEACEQPIDYVAIAGDTCPLDSNKTEPGDCGCGVEEGTCDTTCASPEYNPSIAYRNAGSLVLFEGKVFENKWYTRGDTPTDGGPWKLIKVCSAETTDCSSIADWSITQTYANGGTEIQYNGNIYRNKWYTRGDSPENSNVWDFIGICTSNDDDTISQKTLSTTAVLAAKGINIYPTAVKNILYIDTASNLTVELFNISGKAVGSWEITSGKNQISMTNFSNGLYLIKIDGNIQKLYKL